MNKTVNINLGGMFFHIDEDAYLKLSRYFDAIKRSLTNSSGQDEIIKDIEMRVSELLTEKQKSEKHVVGIKDVDEVIAVMGQPEDYRIDDEGTTDNTKTIYTANRTKKLYRDKDKAVIGGVASGLGYYFGIDAVWIRIFLIVLVWIGGTGVLAYFILWIIIPEAVTTAEKLEMTGEPVTISNIEKKVREEFETVSEKIKNVDYDKFGNQIKSNAQKIGGSFGDFILTLFKIFTKFIGAFIVIIASVVLIALLVSLCLGSSTYVHAPWIDYFNSFNYTEASMILISFLFFLAIGIPVFSLLLLGLKIMIAGMKSIGAIAKYTLIGIWIIAISILFSLGVRQANEVSSEGKIVTKHVLALKPNDTLFVKFRTNDYYSKNVNEQDDFKIVHDSANNELLYSNDVRIKIVKTEEKQAYIQIEKSANGKSFTEAKQRAEKINYIFKIEGNHLLLDNYLLTDFKNKYRGQEVKLYLYLPAGLYLQPDSSLKNYDESDNDYFNLHHSSDYLYKVENAKVKCLNCPLDENEYDDVESDNTEVSISNKGIIIKTDTLKSNNRHGELKINKDGIIIKTK